MTLPKKAFFIQLINPTLHIQTVSATAGRFARAQYADIKTANACTQARHRSSCPKKGCHTKQKCHASTLPTPIRTGRGHGTG